MGDDFWQNMAARAVEARPHPTQAQTLAWVAQRWPDRTGLIWRAGKLCEEAGEVMGAVIKMDEGRKTLDDLRMETAQVVICAMALAEAAGFDLRNAVTDEYHRATDPGEARTSAIESLHPSNNGRADQ